MSSENTRLRAQLQESQVQTFKLYVEGATKVAEGMYEVNSKVAEGMYKVNSKPTEALREAFVATLISGSSAPKPVGQGVDAVATIQQAETEACNEQLLDDDDEVLAAQVAEVCRKPFVL
jgi:hypothetical protein